METLDLLSVSRPIFVSLGHVSKDAGLDLKPFFSRAVVFNLRVATHVGVVGLFSSVAKASDKNINNFFHILYFVYGTTFCCSPNNRISWQKR